LKSASRTIFRATWLVYQTRGKTGAFSLDPGACLTSLGVDALAMLGGFGAAAVSGPGNGYTGWIRRLQRR